MGAWIILELTAGDPGAVIAAVTSAGIPMYDILQKTELSVVFRINKAYLDHIRKLAHRKGWQVQITQKKGIFWHLKGFVFRPVLVVFLFLLCLISVYLPGKILKVEVAGNHLIPRNQILEAADRSGIGFWADRREVRSEKVKNTLLGELPQLQWAGVNTYGSLAVITVRERTMEEKKSIDSAVSSIVASRDGVILSTVTTRGNCLVAPGQAVRTGDTLISGIADLETVVHMTRAEGEVFARTIRQLTVKTPDQIMMRAGKNETIENYSLIIGKKRINFYKGSGIYDTSCVKMYSKYVLTLPGGFSLPVTIVKETVSAFDLSDSRRDEFGASEELSQFAERYLRQLMIAGIIVSSREELTSDHGWVLSGSYECQEMIGREIPEEIGVYNGKTD